MKDAALKRLAETLGWIAYLHVVGAGEYRRELLKLDRDLAFERGSNRAPARSAAQGPAKVLRLQEYRERRRRRVRPGTARDDETSKVA